MKAAWIEGAKAMHAAKAARDLARPAPRRVGCKVRAFAADLLHVSASNRLTLGDAAEQIQCAERSRPLVIRVARAALSASIGNARFFNTWSEQRAEAEAMLRTGWKP